ncbi:MAG: ATP-binding cassette domain-containing protein, partial [Lachnospiraceae bacterium]|nr:ATP-binding cassette domain-containing protein [Lachnospiraceae bacterium]
ASELLGIVDERKEKNEGYIKLVNAKGENGVCIESDTVTNTWAWKDDTKENDKLTKLEGDIVLTNVDFSYVKDKKVLKDINIYAHKGQKIALVGATGSGKTTIINLLNRFYDIDSGSITYDGIDISRINKVDLRASIALVLQDVHLFTGTIMENIRFGRLSATDEECIEASKLAGAHRFIMGLENGYDTVLTGGGSNLSQGQKQLLSIARAAVANPPVMILDEATSSIDTRTEKIVQDGMDSIMKGRTVFVIAHRLSTIKNSDAIMVISNGEILERGNHESLLEKGGMYYQLYTGKLEID